MQNVFQQSWEIMGACSYYHSLSIALNSTFSTFLQAGVCLVRRRCKRCKIEPTHSPRRGFPWSPADTGRCNRQHGWQSTCRRWSSWPGRTRCSCTRLARSGMEIWCPWVLLYDRNWHGIFLMIWRHFSTRRKNKNFNGCEAVINQVQREGSVSHHSRWSVCLIWKISRSTTQI